MMGIVSATLPVSPELPSGKIDLLPFATCLSAGNSDPIDIFPVALLCVSVYNGTSYLANRWEVEMERRISVQQLVEIALQQLKAGDTIVLELPDGQELVILTQAEHQRLQAGQRNPDAGPIGRTAGQRNPDAGPIEQSAGQRNPD